MKISPHRYYELSDHPIISSKGFTMSRANSFHYRSANPAMRSPSNDSAFNLAFTDTLKSPSSISSNARPLCLRLKISVSAANDNSA